MLLVTFLWAANAVAGKFALRGFSPMALAELRVAGATAGFLVVYVILRGWPRLHFTRREWGFMALAGLNGVTLNQGFYVTGLSSTSVAHTALIVALGPVIVLVLACLLHMEKLTAAKAIGMAIAFCGVAALALGKPASGATGVGDLLMLAGRVAFAYYTILLKQAAGRFDALTLTMVTFGLGGLMLAPVGIPSVAKIQWRGVTPAAWAGLAFMIIFASVVAYLLFAHVLTVMTASQAAAYIYLSPVIAIGLGVWLLSEIITWKVLLGGAMILFGLFLTGQGKREPEAGTAE
ncbi:MAG: DMT family transporter [Acidobacteriota bacterium]|nr:DMT family transporter [Acidobacteriota bacterium]